METLLKIMMGVGGAVALFGGLALIVFGDQMRARDERAGRITAAYPTRERQRRTAYVITAFGAVCVLLLFVF